MNRSHSWTRAQLIILAVFVSTIGFSSVSDADEIELNHEEILALFPGLSIQGDGAQQSFRPNGETTHTRNGSSRLGKWKVVSGYYCSSWPPNWNDNCYAVRRDGEVLIFVAPDGRRTIRRIDQEGPGPSWQRLNGTEISLLLPRALLRRPGITQTFESNGATVWTSGGSSSHGRWSVDLQSRYCSAWNGAESCYRVERFGNKLAFIDGSGSRTVYDIAPR